MSIIGMKQIENSADIAIYSYIFEGEKDSFTIQDIRSEMAKKGLELTNAEVRDRIGRFIDLGFVCQEYRRYVRCNI